jgi:hypothetical protein
VDDPVPSAGPRTPDRRHVASASITCERSQASSVWPQLALCYDRFSPHARIILIAWDAFRQWARRYGDRDNLHLTRGSGRAKSHRSYPEGYAEMITVYHSIGARM